MRVFRETDLAEVNGWEKAQGLQPSELDALSTAGWIVPGVAAGWLYITDSNFCLLDGVVTNPAAPAEARGQALSGIQKQARDAAKVLGFKHLVAICTDSSLLKRGLELYGYTAGRSAQLLHLKVN